MFLGSDAIALAPFTNSITYLEDGDWAVVTPRRRRRSSTCDGKPVERQRQQSRRHQLHGRQGQPPPFHGEGNPRAAGGDLAHAGAICRFRRTARRSRSTLPFDFAKLDRLAISACGTAYLAGLIGKYWFERYARLPVDIDIASEFRYREMPLSKTSAALFISQSGETADTLASLRYCRKRRPARSAPSSTCANRPSRAKPM